MEDLIDLIATDTSAAEVSDQIKNILFTKAAERIDAFRPYVATTIFGEQEEESSDEESSDE
jgi:hypothetical protein